MTIDFAIQSESYQNKLELIKHRRIALNSQLLVEVDTKNCIDYNTRWIIYKLTITHC